MCPPVPHVLLFQCANAPQPSASPAKIGVLSTWLCGEPLLVPYFPNGDGRAAHGAAKTGGGAKAWCVGGLARSLKGLGNGKQG